MSSRLLITGANRGIGLALATHYAPSATSIIATARDPGSASALARLAATHPAITLMPLDVTIDASISSLAAALANHALDILICNAGVLGTREVIPSRDYTPAMWAEVFATNVAGVYHTIAALLANLSLASPAKIAIISSSMGSSARPGGGYYAYRASKAAVANLAANLAIDLKDRGIAVAAYHPGWVRTDMGGPAATLNAATSASGLASRIAHLSLATSGVFEDYQGNPVPY